MKFLLVCAILICSVLPGHAGVKDSIVMVRSINEKGRSEGTGFFIASDRVLTAGHIVAGSKSVVVVTYGGIHATAEVIFYSEKFDLAVLALTYSSQSYLEFAGNPGQGADIVIIGHPFGIPYVELYGKVSGYMTCQVDTECLLLDAALIHGVSGAPVLYKGRVVGVALGVLTVKGVPMSGYGVGLPTEKFISAIGGYLEKF